MLQIVLSRHLDKDNDKYTVGFDRILLNKPKGFLGIFALLAVRVGRSAVRFLIENCFPCICCQFLEDVMV
jgi:hypothetical protein